MPLNERAVAALDRAIASASTGNFFTLWWPGDYDLEAAFEYLEWHTDGRRGRRPTVWILTDGADIECESDFGNTWTEYAALVGIIEFLVARDFP